MTPPCAIVGAMYHHGCFGVDLDHVALREDHLLILIVRNFAHFPREEEVGDDANDIDQST